MEFTVNGASYSNKKLSARQQLHVARRLLTVLGPMAPALMRLRDGDKDSSVEIILASLAKAIGQMSDEDMDFVIDACLMSCQRQEKGGWQRVMIDGGQIMYPDIDAGAMVQIAVNVIRDNLANFSLALPPESSVPGAGAAHS